MTHTERTQIKELVKNTFWQFEDEPLETITPSLVRQFACSTLHPDVIEATAVMFPSRSEFWYRVEKLCYLMKQLHYWHSLGK